MVIDICNEIMERIQHIMRGNKVVGTEFIDKNYRNNVCTSSNNCVGKTNHPNFITTIEYCYILILSR